MDDKDLKIEALLQRVSEITRVYEDKVADLRVEITNLSRRIEASESNVVDAEEVTE